MIITEFKSEHIEQAMQLALANYMEERVFVPVLPLAHGVPNLNFFAENNLGYAAMEGDRLVGFLCWWPPRRNFWLTTNVKGVFTPMHGHGAISENRDRIYPYLFQAAANRLVREKVLIYSISLYAHDQVAKDSFYYNGFGLRFIDSVRPMEEISFVESTGCTYCELAVDEFHKVLPLNNLLIDHLSSPPIFLHYNPMTEDTIVQAAKEHHTRYFAAKKSGDVIAYIKVEDEGENFACYDSSMKNICGAYCLHEYRGNGIFQNLLAYLISVLKKEGYTRLGVDFESFNPTARGFWLKHFTEYTSGVVRRIDERILKRL